MKGISKTQRLATKTVPMVSHRSHVSL